MGFYFTLEVLVYLDLFSVSVGIRTCPCLICYECVQFQIEIQEISRCGSRSPNNAEFDHFTLLFSRGRQRNQCTKNRPRSIYQYSSMAPRLSGQTSIFGVVFFVSKSLLGIERQKKL